MLLLRSKGQVRRVCHYRFNGFPCVEAWRLV